MFKYIKNIIGSKNFMKHCGDFLAVSMPVGLLFILKGDMRRKFIAKFLISYFVTYVIKFTIRSPRPDLSNNYSFPSAHMVSSFIVAHYYYKYYKSNNILTSGILYLLSIFVGYTRIKFKKHYNRDVIGAIIIVLALNSSKLK